LPKVYTALGIKMKAKPQKSGFASLRKKFMSVDLYQCVLCRNRMVLTARKPVSGQKIYCRDVDRNLRQSDSCGKQHREDLSEILIRHQNSIILNNHQSHPA